MFSNLKVFSGGFLILGFLLIFSVVSYWFLVVLYRYSFWGWQGRVTVFFDLKPNMAFPNRQMFLGPKKRALLSVFFLGFFSS